MNKPKIVVLGAGLGGTIAAYEIQAAAKGGKDGAAALHSAFIAARQSKDVEAWIVGLDQLPEPTDRLGRALRRNLAVLDPRRMVWTPWMSVTTPASPGTCFGFRGMRWHESLAQCELDAAKGDT